MPRLVKTDNPALLGVHVFERAGLGTAPFRVIGYDELKHSDGPGCPVRPGGSCDYCSTAIMYACVIQGSDGRTFKVGCDCVAKTGDAGLLRAYKTTPGYRAHQKALRDAKDVATKTELARLLADTTVRACLEARIYTCVTPWGLEKTGTWLAAVERILPLCGAQGRGTWLKAIQRVLAETAHDEEGTA
jgi:hypothetical protein